MRIFWIVLILVIAGAGVAIFTGSDSDTPTPALPTAATTPAPQETPIASEIDSAPARQEIIADTADAIAEEVEQTTEAIAEIPAPVETPVIEEAESAIAEITEEAPADEATTEESKELAIVDLTADDIAEALAENATPAPTTTDEAAPGWDALAENAPAETAEAPAEFVAESLPVTTLDDGRLQIGDRFTIAGKGTKEEPYALPWDFLVAIREAYSPREGRKAIPDHFAFFEGKYVAISGYLQFPLASPEPTECLIMLNQWDGCCIGVPPTPYDAIEVALSVPATQAEKFAVEGRIVGKLDIDPYLVGNWLIGLYLLGDGTLDVSGSRSAEEVYGNTPSQMMPGQ